MAAAEVPPPPAAPPAQVIVVSRRDGTEVVASSDMALALSKGAQREQALVRQAVFLTTSLSVTRPASPDTAALDTYRWTHQAFLQRQVCVTSLTGLFACTEPTVQALPNRETGEAPVSPLEPEAAPASEAARKRLAEGLKPRAAALFEADRRLHLEPLFKASAVTVVRPPAKR